jgi:hypothetical protein
MESKIGARQLVLAWLLAVFTATGIAYAAIPGPDGAIHACFKKSGGALRVIDTSLGACAANENAIQWNQLGQPGAPGAPGVSGYEVVVSEQANPPSLLRGGMRVPCPDNKVVLGGGAGVADEEGVVPGDVIQSHPESDGSGEHRGSDDGDDSGDERRSDGSDHASFAAADGVRCSTRERRMRFASSATPHVAATAPPSIASAVASRVESPSRLRNAGTVTVRIWMPIPIPTAA